ncbi:DUF928 domain-containing protein [Oscillatoria sp. FACHB-1407]|uniref:DUF928 domain-containing protein n=1 Tax=Oscillatoria sp. FACHB-1407 TaxID=2692847 RepID=UPI0016879EE0|nr:DUF928 domain-containing protein [Oscillatoria sp. FACHB-1407]MBD2465123.1 DUF928 domain-containing protein [Oscillatoria sp. FACHB-1407]
MLLQLPKLRILLAGLLIYGLLPFSVVAVDARAAEIGFEPSPDNGRPNRTTAGGSRNPGYCPNDRSVSQPLAAVPSTQSATGQAASQTVDPLAVQIQVPETSARAAEFSLFDESGRGVYQTRLALEQPGIIRIALPEAASQLQSNRRYRWVFSLICQPDDRLQDRSVSGWIQPAQPSTTQN